jgi:hypothetical protein
MEFLCMRSANKTLALKRLHGQRTAMQEDAALRQFFDSEGVTEL